MITIQPGVTRMLCSHLGHAVSLLVRGEPVQTLEAALRAAMPDVENLVPEHVHVEVNGPVPVPGGFLFLGWLGEPTPPSVRAVVPDLLARRMEQAGITDAEIRVAPLAGERHKVLDSFAPIARAWLRGSGDRRARWREGTRPWLEPRLIDAGAEWLRHEHQPGTELNILVGRVEMPVSPETLRPVVSSILGTENYTVALASDFATAAASVIFGQFMGCGLTLSAAERNWQAGDVTARMRQQQEFIRQHADLPELAWAGATAEPARSYSSTIDFTAVHPLQDDDYPDSGRVWYQLLSPDQLRRLGQPPAGAVELPGGRMELTIGEPEEWIPGKRGRRKAEARARRLLRI